MHARHANAHATASCTLPSQERESAYVETPAPSRRLPSGNYHMHALSAPLMHACPRRKRVRRRVDARACPRAMTMVLGQGPLSWQLPGPLNTCLSGRRPRCIIISTYVHSLPARCLARQLPLSQQLTLGGCRTSYSVPYDMSWGEGGNDR